MGGSDNTPRAEGAACRAPPSTCPVSELVDHLVDQLAPLGGVSARRMFGGHGIFRDGLMFALVAGDCLYFKVDDDNRAEFEARGLEPFRYAKKGKLVALSYHQAPEEAMDDGEELCRWARPAFAAALRAHRGTKA